MSWLERKWWFMSITSFLGFIATLLLFKTAEYSLPFYSGSSLSQYAVFFATFFCLQRALSLGIWLAVLVFNPKIAMRED